jgi:hypothetical protein
MAPGCRTESSRTLNNRLENISWILSAVPRAGDYAS